MAATDWMKALPDLVRPWIDAPFVTLGTDGFGRSDTRENLRAYFEIDAPNIAAAALDALARAGDITPEAAAKGI
ncbi:pyruvate dehydrogenase (acetyl-transferring), homodimeric type, partial [Escherichia marmotae]|nr:pyruvate dehydrogenase (acetyl-transferring), homodimeric type [Escherichia marmotae]